MKKFWNRVVLAVCGTYGVWDLSLLTKPVRGGGNR